MRGYLKTLFRKKREAVCPAALRWSLEQTLMSLSRRDSFTIGNAVENVLIVGGIGSGKTSGSGRHLAMAYLSSGMGGLVLAVKPDEPQLWESLAKATGRSDDLILFGPDAPHRFDPLAFQLTCGTGAHYTQNLTETLAALLDLSERLGGNANKNGEAYWKFSLAQLQRNTIELCVMATGTVSVPDLYRIVISIAHSVEEMRSDQWRANSTCFRYLRLSDERAKTSRQQEELALVADYFLIEMPNLSEKTRSVIVSSFTSMIDLLNRGILKELFCSGTTIDPTAIEQGKIIVVNMPIKTFGQVGLYAACLWKLAFMKSIERRSIETSPRPVMLWQDEGQFMMLPLHDMLFTSTSRSSRVANVLLTQSISGIIAQLGSGPAGKAEADAYLSNFGTKIFHSNTDTISNLYTADLIGRSKQFVINTSNSYQNNTPHGGYGSRESAGGSSGISEIFEYELQPQELAKLRTGGPANDGIVDAIVLRNGVRFNTSGRNWMKVSFKQASQH